MTWLKFYNHVQKGEETKLSRSARFVYLELVYEALAWRGVIGLPQKWTDAAAVHDILGGNHREVAGALRALKSARLLRFEANPHQLIIENWRRICEARCRPFIPSQVREAVRRRDGLVCQLCYAPVSSADVHLDHIAPFSAGGTDTVENLRVTHSQCNLRRRLS